VFRLFAQLGGGLGYVRSELGSDVEQHVEHDFGPHVALGAGAFWMWSRHFGGGLQMSYEYAPLLGDQIGDHHDSGGLALTLNLRYRSWEQP
jgi:hypothetical protein